MTAAVSIHLTFSGQCEEALRSYQHVLGGTVTVLSYGDSPMADSVPADWRSKVAHGSLTTDGMTLAGADVHSYERPRGFSVLLEVTELARAREIFNALAVEGEINMPFQETFWSPGFGVLVDRFGIPWEINCAGR